MGCVVTKINQVQYDVLWECLTKYSANAEENLSANQLGSSEVGYFSTSVALKHYTTKLEINGQKLRYLISHQEAYTLNRVYKRTCCSDN